MSSNFHPFKDMKESARAQHELDKANFAAVRADRKPRGKKQSSRQNSVRQKCRRNVKSNRESKRQNH